MEKIQKIEPTLWFDDQAEEAARLYVSIFKNSEIGQIDYYGKEGFEYHQKPEGSVLTVEFTIEGQKFIALNGGPVFRFSEAISFVINCDTQEEVDYYWDNLLANGGEEQMCGWLKDKFGVSWQVVPVVLNKMLRDPDRAKASRVANAMFKMKKLDIAVLQKAYNNN